MLDLKAQYAAIKPEIDAAVAEVFTEQRFRGGPPVEQFEATVAEFLGVPHALGVSTGTDALLLPLRAMGLRAGDEVITTPFTFFATAGAIVNAGGKPVFVDIDPITFTLNPEAVREAVTEKTKAIIPVHLYGQCADMDPLLQIAAEHGIYVLEDTAQAIGARYKDRPAGSLGDAAALSFYPTKNLGAAGEGGMALTRYQAIADSVRLLRSHGAEQVYHHSIVGTNSHLHTLQAAVLLVKLRHLETWNDARRRHAAYYDAALDDIYEVVTPRKRPENEHVYHQYVIRIPERERCCELLREREIGFGIFYPLCLHQQPCFEEFGCAAARCPEAERAAQEVLALPIYPELTQNQLDEVIAAIKDHLAQG